MIRKFVRLDNKKKKYFSLSETIKRIISDDKQSLRVVIRRVVGDSRNSDKYGWHHCFLVMPFDRVSVDLRRILLEQRIDQESSAVLRSDSFDQYL